MRKRLYAIIFCGLVLVACTSRRSGQETATPEPVRPSQETPTPEPASPGFAAISALYPHAPDWVDGSIKTLAVSSDGAVWVGSNSRSSGLHHSTDGGASWRDYSTKDGLPGNLITALAVGPNDDLWVGTRGGLALSTDAGQSWQTVLISSTWKQAPHDIQISANGVVWLLAQEQAAFSQNSGQTWQVIDVPGKTPVFLAVDSEGTAYIARSCNRYTYRADQDASSPDHCIERVKTTMLCCQGISIDAYSPEKGALYGGFVSPPTPDACLDIHDLAITTNDTLWSIDLSDNFNELFAVEFEKEPPTQYWTRRSAWCLGLARDGGIWAGQTGQVSRYRRRENAIVVNKTVSGLPKCSLINIIVEAPDGTLWVGVDAGLYRTVGP